MHSVALYIQGAPTKIPYKKLCISAMVARISAKLSDFICKYLRNMSCKFHWNSWYGL